MNTQPAGEIILYQRGDAPAIDVRLDSDTVWLSQQQLADLFQTSRTNVVEHIANIYAEDELSQEATCRKFRQVRTEGTRQVTRALPFYNLDLITQQAAQPSEVEAVFLETVKQAQKKIEGKSRSGQGRTKGQRDA